MKDRKRVCPMKTAQNESLSDPVYEYLCNAILTMEIKPGERIPEASIAERFGVSRTPIREAMRRLENEGLIRRYPNRFAEVVTFSAADIANLGVVRLSLDITAVKLAVFYGSNADFLRLREIAEECHATAEAGERSKRIKLDSKFHLEISRISQNPIIEKYQSQILLQIELIQAARYKDSIDAIELTKPHFAIVDAMMKRDEDLSVRLVREHLIDFYNLDDTFPFLKESAD